MHRIYRDLLARADLHASTFCGMSQRRCGTLIWQKGQKKEHEVISWCLRTGFRRIVAYTLLSYAMVLLLQARNYQSLNNVWKASLVGATFFIYCGTVSLLFAEWHRKKRYLLISLILIAIGWVYPLILFDRLLIPEVFTGEMKNLTGALLCAVFVVTLNSYHKSPRKLIGNRSII